MTLLPLSVAKRRTLKKEDTWFSATRGILATTPEGLAKLKTDSRRRRHYFWQSNTTLRTAQCVYWCFLPSWKTLLPWTSKNLEIQKLKCWALVKARDVSLHAAAPMKRVSVRLPSGKAWDKLNRLKRLKTHNPFAGMTWRLQKPWSGRLMTMNNFGCSLILGASARTNRFASRDWTWLKN